MGLDITAYSKVERGVTNDPDDACHHDEVYLYVNPDFPAQADGLTDGGYKYNDRFSFRAGSYSGYNRWRAALCRAVHGVEPESLWGNGDAAKASYPAFFELIHFSDCEGVIGPVTSAKLYRDFLENTDKVADYMGDKDDGEYFLLKYKEWLNAFRLASNGVVKFH